jgi:inorganic pyrophosphatase
MAPPLDLVLPPFARPDLLNVIVETPAGSRIKYTWQPELKMFKVTRVLGSGLRFPNDFGFVPGTRADGGLPLVALVLSDGPLAVGSLVECRVLGAIEVATCERPGGPMIRADRLVVVPDPSWRGRTWTTLTDLRDAAIADMTGFLRNYERESPSRAFELLGTVGPREALKLVERARA